MTLEDLLTNLSYGELSNLAIGNDGAGYIEEKDIPKLVMYLNQSLFALYSRFILNQQELVLQSFDHVTFYYLRKEHAYSNVKSDKLKYIIDSDEEPFTDNVLRVLQVFNEVGNPLPIGDDEQYSSIYLPQYDCVQLTHPCNDDIFSIIYQASHPIINNADLNQRIDIPYFLEEALQAHIAYKVFSHMSGGDNSAKAMEHMQRYENICINVEEKDLVNNSVTQTNIKAIKRGWK